MWWSGSHGKGPRGSPRKSQFLHLIFNSIFPVIVYINETITIKDNTKSITWIWPTWIRALKFSQFIQINAYELSNEETLHTIPLYTQYDTVKEKVQGWLTDTAASNWTLCGLKRNEGLCALWVWDLYLDQVIQSWLALKCGLPLKWQVHLWWQLVNVFSLYDVKTCIIFKQEVDNPNTNENSNSLEIKCNQGQFNTLNMLLVLQTNVS